jgi:hypothetical protein
MAGLARYLIGTTIVRNMGRNRMSGRIVETEACPQTIRPDMLTVDMRQATTHFRNDRLVIPVDCSSRVDPAARHSVTSRSCRCGDTKKD